MKLMCFAATAAATAIALCAAPAFADHFYGINPGDNDPPIDVINGVLFGNGTVTGTLAASLPQPNEAFDHVVFYANVGDSLTVDTIGSNQDSGLAILGDTQQDGIFVGDAPPNTGNQLSFLGIFNDDSVGLDSLVVFNAPYTGAYLAAIAEIGGGRMNWVLNVRGSTYVPEPATLSLLIGPLLLMLRLRRRAC